MGQFCYGNLKCDPVAVKPGDEWKLNTERPTPRPVTATPTGVLSPTTSRPTEAPTAYSNPDKKYCSSEWKDMNYDGVCGEPCPRGLDGDCPTGQFCYIQPKCIDEWAPPTASPLPPPPSAAPATPAPTEGPSRRPVATDSPTRAPTPPPSTNPSREPSKRPSRSPSEFPTLPPFRPRTDRPVASTEQVVALTGNGESNGMVHDDPTDLTDLTDDVYLRGKLRSSYYCGWSFYLMSHTCNMAAPCPTGLHADCPSGQTCFPNTPCAWLQTPTPTSTPTRVFIESKPDPPIRTPLPTTKPTPGSIISITSVPSPPTATTSNNGHHNNYISRCGSDRDCRPGQFCNRQDPRVGVHCGECAADGTGCSTEEACRTGPGCRALDQVGEPGAARCYGHAELDRDCQIRMGDDGAGCNVAEMVCEVRQRTAAQQGSIVAASHSIDAGSGSAAGAARHQNPKDNIYFCGARFSDITNDCLQSKPCPGGFASRYCDDHEGCFSAPVCAAQYVLANGFPPPSPPPTPNPSNGPTRHPTQNPSKQPTKSPTPNPFPNPDSVASAIASPSWESEVVNRPATPAEMSDSTTMSMPSPIVGNFCGTQWNLLLSTCETATKCPIGNECPLGEGCFENFVCNLPMVPPTPPSPTAPAAALSSTNHESSGTKSNFATSIGSSGSLAFDIGGETKPSTTGQTTPQGQSASFQGCSLCGANDLDGEAIALLAGEEVSCRDLESKLFAKEKDIGADSPKCELGRSIYSGTCCIEAPENVPHQSTDQPIVSWYTAVLSSSPASSYRTPIRPFWFLTAVGLIVISGI